MPTRYPIGHRDTRIRLFESDLLEFFMHSRPVLIVVIWHHYQTEDRRCGVSSPLWDYVFGTMPER